MPGLLSELLATESPSPGIYQPRPDARAKLVIMIYATGGVSHIDTFDPKAPGKGRDGTGPDKLMGNLSAQGEIKNAGPR